MLFLEKELVALGGMCAASLLKEDTVLPFAGAQLTNSVYTHNVSNIIIIMFVCFDFQMN